jgi:uncharacterized membrane protein
MELEDLVSILLIVISIALSIYALPALPQDLASHWDMAGEVNGHMPAFWGAFLMPAISAALFMMFLAIPLIDPLSANIKAFQKDYHRFILVLILFLFLVHIQILLWNLGTKIGFNLTIPILLGGLFFYLGTLLGRVKRNWFIGIRTPWTMSSDEVWDKTHRLGGKLFKAVGVISILSILLPTGGILVVIALIIAAAISTVVYSYLAYRDIMAGRKNVKNKQSGG